MKTRPTLTEEIREAAEPCAHLHIEALAAGGRVCVDCGLVSHDGGETWYDDGGERHTTYCCAAAPDHEHWPERAATVPGTGLCAHCGEAIVCDATGTWRLDK